MLNARHRGCFAAAFTRRFCRGGGSNPPRWQNPFGDAPGFDRPESRRSVAPALPLCPSKNPAIPEESNGGILAAPGDKQAACPQLAGENLSSAPSARHLVRRTGQIAANRRRYFNATANSCGSGARRTTGSRVTGCATTSSLACNARRLRSGRSWGRPL